MISVFGARAAGRASHSEHITTAQNVIEAPRQFGAICLGAARLLRTDLLAAGPPECVEPKLRRLVGGADPGVTDRIYAFVLETRPSRSGMKKCSSAKVLNVKVPDRGEASMKVWSGICLIAGLSGCVAQAPVAEGLMHPFACPVTGMETVTEDAAGKRARTIWLGADPDDPLLCRSENGGGTKQRARLFGRWDLETERIGGTTEEKSSARQAITALLSGRTRAVGFILRGRSGEQTVQHWGVQEAEDLDIGGRQVRTVRIHVSFTYGGNGAAYSTDLWFAPEFNLFVQSKGSLERSQAQSWKMVRIKAAA